jgi:hypothetical protein
VLSVLVLLGGERKSNAAFALTDLLSGRGLKRRCETLSRGRDRRRSSPCDATEHGRRS